MHLLLLSRLFGGGGFQGGNPTRSFPHDGRIPVVAVKLNGPVELERPAPDEQVDPAHPYWQHPTLEACLPPPNEREFRVFPSQRDAAEWLTPGATQGYASSTSYKVISAILHYKRTDGRRAGSPLRAGCQRATIRTTLKLPAATAGGAPTYWTFARPWHSTVVEHLLAGEGVVEGGHQTTLGPVPSAAGAAP